MIHLPRFSIHNVSHIHVEASYANPAGIVRKIQLRDADGFIIGWISVHAPTNSTRGATLTIEEDT